MILYYEKKTYSNMDVKIKKYSIMITVSFFVKLLILNLSFIHCYENE